MYFYIVLDVISVISYQTVWPPGNRWQLYASFISSPIQNYDLQHFVQTYLLCNIASLCWMVNVALKQLLTGKRAVKKMLQHTGFQRKVRHTVRLQELKRIWLNRLYLPWCTGINTQGPAGPPGQLSNQISDWVQMTFLHLYSIYATSVVNDIINCIVFIFGVCMREILVETFTRPAISLLSSHVHLYFGLLKPWNFSYFKYPFGQLLFVFSFSFFLIKKKANFNQ